ncbi:MAG: hypothetical protein HPY53_05245 [Brevinematales bacterium]|nr:hypothetical protein [Brevinematales bacterium]
MKVEISENQYKVLTRALSMADIITEAVKEENPELDFNAEEYSDLFEYFTAFCKDFHSEEDFNKHEGKFYPNRQFEEFIFEDILSNYEESYFWEELSDKLGRRDMSKKYDMKSQKEMDNLERFKLLDKFITPYEEEFIENGIMNLYIKKSKERG